MTHRTAWALVALSLACAACQSEPPAAAPSPAPRSAATTPPTAAPTVAATTPPSAATTMPAATAGFAGPGCRIKQDGATAYEGPCDIRLDAASGSFHLSPRGAKDIGGANPLTVSPQDDGEAEVRGLTADGINARWGAAKKSATDPACWVGDDFEICASPLPGGAPSAPGALPSAAWGKGYFVVVVAVGARGDAALTAAVERARTLGAPAEAIDQGFDCETGLNAQTAGAPPDGDATWVRFDTKENAQAFADRVPGAKVLPATNACGG
jgi:hypothetical protein